LKDAVNGSPSAEAKYIKIRSTVCTIPIQELKVAHPVVTKYAKRKEKKKIKIKTARRIRRETIPWIGSALVTGCNQITTITIAHFLEIEIERIPGTSPL
jgi:hypothetical protein